MRNETHTHLIDLVGQGPKGEIFKAHGYWHWRGNSGSVERFPKRMKLHDVGEHVAHLCRAPGFNLTSANAMWRLKLTRYPSKTIHKGILVDGIHPVPICQPGIGKAWHKLPDNSTANCKRCEAIIAKRGLVYRYGGIKW